MPRKKIVKQCKFCKKEKLLFPNWIYCSRSCYYADRFGKGKSEYRNCLTCGKKFRVYFSAIKAGWGKGKYCSRKCYYEAPKSEEFKDKISKKFSGSNHPNWKGGIMKGRKDRNLNKYKNWRNKIFKRDKYICWRCKIKNEKGLGKTIKLVAHHIENWSKHPELRYEIENGITFCKSCHEKFHKKYGIKNNNFKQVKEFIYDFMLGSKRRVI